MVNSIYDIILIFIYFLDCVFVSSFTGVLRAYRPIPGPFSPDHLLLETKLSAPIIQIGTGQLIM